MRKLVSYWTMFSFISLFEHIFERLIERVLLWPYIKLITLCWLVIPHFDGAWYLYQTFVHPCLLVDLHDVITQLYSSCYVYQLFLYDCLSVYLQAVTDWFNTVIEDPSLKNETFLAMAERYLEENGSDALEKLIASKIKDHNLNNYAEEIKITRTCDEAGRCGPSQVNSLKENLTQIEKKTTGMQVKEVIFPADSEKIKIPEFTSSEHVQTEWTCEVCQVTTSSELNLKSYLKGREHKENYEGLKTCKQTAKGEGSPPVTTKSFQLNQEQVKHDASSGSEKSTNEKLKEMVHLAATGHQEKPKHLKNADVAVHNSALWCGTCNIWCPAEIVMTAHLKGRKHLAKLHSEVSSTSVAQRYLEENRSDAMEKLIANKSKDYSLDHHAAELETTDTRDNTGILTPSQMETEEGGPVREAIKVTEHMTEHEAVETQQVESVTKDPIQIERTPTGMQVKEMVVPAYAEEIKVPGITSPKQVQTEWTCALCQVSITTDHDFRCHLLGRKHRKKCKDLQKTYSNMAKSEGSLPVTSNSINQEQVKNDVAARSEHITKENLKEVVHLAVQQEAAGPKQVKSAKEDLIRTEKKMAGMQVKELVVPADAEEFKIPEITSSEQVQTEWTCALCHVTTTSEVSLKSHLNGREHKENCEGLTTCKQTAKSERSPPVTTKSIQLNQEQVKNEAAVKHGASAGSEQSTNENLKGMVHLAATGQQEKPKHLKNADVIFHNSGLWCGTCNIWCPAEIVMASHLNGRKHLAKTQTLMSSTAVAERHLEENGSDPLEKVAANKPKDYSLDHHTEEIKTTGSSDNAGMLIPSQIVSEKGGLVREDIKVMDHMRKNEAPDAKQIKSLTENLVQTEKKITGMQVKEMVVPADADEIKLPEIASSKQGQSAWTCALCQVTTTSELNLKSHLNGREHKEQVKHEAAAGSEHSSNEKLEEMVHLAATGQQEKPKHLKNGDVVFHNSRLWCGTCNIWCPAEIVMASHLNGRKHLAKTQAIMSSIAVAERHLEENGSDALEKVAANKVRRWNDNLIWAEKKTTGGHVALVAQGKQHCTNEGNVQVEVGATGEDEKQKQVKNSELWCCFCNFTCTSENVMAAHVIGQKHLERLHETMSSTTRSLEYANMKFYQGI